MTDVICAQHMYFKYFQILVATLFLCNVKISPLEEELCQLLSDKGKTQFKHPLISVYVYTHKYFKW